MKKILGIVILSLLLSGNAYSESWDVIDIPDKGIKEGDKAWPFAREQAISLCRQKKKFAFQFHATDFSSQTHFPKRMRYFCSRDRLTVDPIEGPTVTYKAFLWAKQREEPNPLIWDNFSEKQKKIWDTQDAPKTVTTKSLSSIKKQCLAFGFKEGTEKFADCQLKLYTLQMQQSSNNGQTIVIEGSTGNNNSSKIDPSVWNDLQGISEGLLKGKSLTESLGGSSSNSSSRTCFKINERTSGTNKICSYNCMGSEVTRNIRSTQICPISIKQ